MREKQGNQEKSCSLSSKKITAALLKSEIQTEIPSPFLIPHIPAIAWGKIESF